MAKDDDFFEKFFDNVFFKVAIVILVATLVVGVLAVTVSTFLRKRKRQG